MSKSAFNTIRSISRIRKFLSMENVKILVHAFVTSSSKTQGQSVAPAEKEGQKFSGMGVRAPGYRLSPDHFQTAKRILAPDWAQKMLCIIVPNRRAVSPEFFP